MAYRPDRSAAAVIFQTKAGSYDDGTIASFLDELHDFLDGDMVTLLWDGLPSHRSRTMQAYTRANRDWLIVEPLPAYAPDLNPVEAHSGAARIGADLAFAFLRHTRLSL